jgi:hypothetical protein
MSDWVGVLIEEAVSRSQIQPASRAAGPKKKMLARLESLPQTDEDGVPIFQKDPFWKRKS